MNLKFCLFILTIFLKTLVSSKDLFSNDDRGTIDFVDHEVISKSGWSAPRSKWKRRRVSRRTLTRTSARIDHPLRTDGGNGLRVPGDTDTSDRLLRTEKYSQLVLSADIDNTRRLIYKDNVSRPCRTKGCRSYAYSVPTLMYFTKYWSNKGRETYVFSFSTYWRGFFQPLKRYRGTFTKLRVTRILDAQRTRFTVRRTSWKWPWYINQTRDYNYFLYPHTWPQMWWNPVANKDKLYWYDYQYGHAPLSKDWLTRYYKHHPTTPKLRVENKISTRFRISSRIGTLGFDYPYWLFKHTAPEFYWDPGQHREKLYWYDKKYGHAPYRKHWLSTYYFFNPTVRVSLKSNVFSEFTSKGTNGTLKYDYWYWMFPHSFPETSWNPEEHRKELYWYDYKYGHAPYNKDWLHSYYKKKRTTPIFFVTSIPEMIVTLSTKQPLTGNQKIDYKWWLYAQSHSKSTWNPFLNKDLLYWYDKEYSHAPYRSDWRNCYYKKYPTPALVRVTIYPYVATKFTTKHLLGPFSIDYEYWLHPHSLSESSWNPEKHKKELYWYDAVYGHAPYKKDWLHSYLKVVNTTFLFRVTSMDSNINSIYTKSPLTGVNGIDYKYWIYPHSSPQISWNPFDYKDALYWYDKTYGHVPISKDWLSNYKKLFPTTTIIRMTLQPGIASKFTENGTKGVLGFDYKYWMYPHSLPETSWNPKEHKVELYWYDYKYGHAPYQKDWLHSYYKQSGITPTFRVTKLPSLIQTLFTKLPLTGVAGKDYKYWLYPHSAPEQSWDPFANKTFLYWYDENYNRAPFKPDWISSYYKKNPTTPLVRVTIYPSVALKFTEKHTLGPFNIDYNYWLHPHSLPETSWNPEEHIAELYWYDEKYGHAPYKKDWLESYYRVNGSTPIFRVTKIPSIIKSIYTKRPLTGVKGIDYKYWLYPHSNSGTTWDPFENKKFLYWYDEQYKHAPYQKDWLSKYYKVFPTTPLIRVTLSYGVESAFTKKGTPGTLGYEYKYWLYPHSLPETSWNPMEHKIELYWYDYKYGHAPYRKDWLHSYYKQNGITPIFVVTEIPSLIQTLFIKVPLTGVAGTDYKYWLYPHTAPQSPWNPLANKDKLYWYNAEYSHAPYKSDWISRYYIKHPTSPIIRVTIHPSVGSFFTESRVLGPLGIDYHYWLYPHSLPETSWNPEKHKTELYWYDLQYGHAPYKKDWLHCYYRLNFSTPIFRVTSLIPKVLTIFSKFPLTGAEGVDYKYWLYPHSKPQSPWNPIENKDLLYWYDEKYGHAPYKKNWIEKRHKLIPTTPIVRVSLEKGIFSKFTKKSSPGVLGFDYKYWMYPHSFPETSWNPKEFIKELYWYDFVYGHAPYRKDWLHSYLSRVNTTLIFRVTSIDVNIGTLYTTYPLTGVGGKDYKYWLYPHTAPQLSWNPVENKKYLYWYNEMYGHAPYKKDWLIRYYKSNPTTPIIRLTLKPGVANEFTSNGSTGVLGYDYKYWMYPHSFPETSWDPIKHKDALYWYDNQYGHAPYKKDWLHSYYKQTGITPTFRVTKLIAAIKTLFTKVPLTGVAGTDYKYWLYPHSAPQTSWDPFANKEMLYWYDNKYGHAPFKSDWITRYYVKNPTTPLVRVTIHPSVAIKFTERHTLGPHSIDYNYWLHPHSFPETSWNPKEHEKELYWYDYKYGHAPYRKDWLHSYFKHHNTDPIVRVTPIFSEIASMFTNNPLTGAKGVDYKYWLYPHSHPELSWDPYQNKELLYWYDAKYGHAPYSRDWRNRYYSIFPTKPILHVTIYSIFTTSPAKGPSGYDYKYWLYPHSLPETSWNPEEHKTELYWYDNKYGHVPYKKDWLHSYLKHHFLVTPVFRVTSIGPEIRTIFTRDSLTGVENVDYKYWLYPHSVPEQPWDPYNNKKLLYWYDQNYGHAPYSKDWISRYYEVYPTSPIIRVTLHDSVVSNFTKDKVTGPLGYDYMYWIYPHSFPETSWNPAEHKVELYWYDYIYGHAPYKKDWLHSFLKHNFSTPIFRVTSIDSRIAYLFTENPLTGVQGVDYKYWLYPHTKPQVSWNPLENKHKLYWYDKKYGHAPIRKDWVSSFYKHNPTTPIIRVSLHRAVANRFTKSKIKGPLGYDYSYWLFPHSLPETSWNPLEHKNELYWYDRVYGHAPYRKDWLHSYYRRKLITPIFRVTSIPHGIQKIFTENPLTGAKSVDYKFWLYPHSAPESSWNPFENKKLLYWYDERFGHAPYKTDWISKYYRAHPTTPIIHVTFHPFVSSNFTRPGSKGILGYDYKYWMHPHSLPQTSWDPEAHKIELYWYDRVYGHAPYKKDWFHSYLRFFSTTPIFRVTPIVSQLSRLFTKNPLTGVKGVDYKYWLYPHTSPNTVWDPIRNKDKLYWYDEKYGHAPYKKNWLSSYYKQNPTTPIIRVSIHSSVGSNFTRKGKKGPLGYDYLYWLYPHSLPETSWNPLKHKKELYWYDSVYGHVPYRKDWLHCYYKKNFTTPIFRVTSIGIDILKIFTNSPLTGADSVDYKHWLYPHTEPDSPWDPLENKQKLYWYDKKYGHAPYKSDWVDVYFKHNPTTPIIHVSIHPSVVGNFTKSPITGPLGFDYMYWMYPHSFPETSWNPLEHKQELYWYDYVYGHAPFYKGWQNSFYKKNYTTPIFRVTSLHPELFSLFTKFPLIGADGVDYKYWLYPHSKPDEPWNPLENKEKLYWYDKNYGRAPIRKDWLSSYYKHNPTTPIIRVSLHSTFGVEFERHPLTGPLGYDYKYWLYPHSLPATSWDPLKHKKELYWYDMIYGHAPYQKDWMHCYLKHNFTTPIFRVTKILPEVLLIFTKDPLTGAEGVDYKYWLYPHTAPDYSWDPLVNRDKLYWYDNQYGHAPYKKGWLSSYYDHHPTTPIVHVSIRSPIAGVFTNSPVTGPLGYDYMYWMYPHSLPETSWNPEEHKKELYWYDSYFGHAPYKKDWLHSYFQYHSTTPRIRVTSIIPEIRNIHTRVPLTGNEGVDYKFWLYPHTDFNFSWNPLEHKRELYWYDKVHGHAPYSSNWLSRYFKIFPTTPIVRVSLKPDVDTLFTENPETGVSGIDYKYWLYPHSKPQVSWDPFENKDKLYWYDSKYGHAPYSKEWLVRYYSHFPTAPIIRVTTITPYIGKRHTKCPLTGISGFDYARWLHPQVHPRNPWNPLLHLKELYWYDSAYGHAPYRSNWLSSFFKNNPTTPIIRLDSLPLDIDRMFTSHPYTGHGGIDYLYWLYPHSAPDVSWNPKKRQKALRWYDRIYGHIPYRRDWLQQYLENSPTTVPRIRVSNMFRDVATAFTINAATGPKGVDYHYWLHPHSVPEVSWNPWEHKAELYRYDDLYGHAPYKKDWKSILLARDPTPPAYARGSRCYRCGLNETGVSSSHCHDAFFGTEASVRRRSLRVRCAPGTRGPLGCFLRHLDVSDAYWERGCRQWPPTRGRSYASERLARLERQLRGQEDGCVTSPHAALSPMARGISLYARYSSCVCSSDLCNASPDSSKSGGFLVYALVFVSVTHIITVF